MLQNCFIPSNVYTDLYFHHNFEYVYPAHKKTLKTAVKLLSLNKDSQDSSKRMTQLHKSSTTLEVCSQYTSLSLSLSLSLSPMS